MALWGQVPAAKPDPWGLPGRTREATPTDCPLTSTLTPEYKRAYTYTHMHTQNKCVKNNMKYWESNIDSTRAFKITMFLKM